MRRTVALAVALAAPSGLGCKDISSFSTAPGESYCGQLVDAEFVRRGYAPPPPPVLMRLTFDAGRVSESPGVLSTSDHVLTSAPLRPILQVFNDPLSTMQFGEGRDRNFLYMVDPSDPSLGPTVTVVLSLMHSGDVEVRLIRGAPALGGDQAPDPTDGTPLFGVFAPLHREAGQCSF